MYQVVLPEAPDQGYIVIYDLPDSTAATTAGTDQATYLGTGPGRVQMPIGTHHVIRQLGSTILLYSWIPGGDADERAPRHRGCPRRRGHRDPDPGLISLPRRPDRRPGRR